MRKKSVGNRRKAAQVPINSCFRLTAENASEGQRRIAGAGYYDAAAEKTFFCWKGERAEVWVGEFDHRSGQFGENRCVFDDETTAETEQTAEPIMVQAADGSPLVFVCRRAETIYQLTGHPHSAAEPFEQSVISTDRNCDPCAVTVRDDVYLLYAREEEPSYRTLCYMKSSDGGKTWETETVLADSRKEEPQGRNAIALCHACYLPNSGVYPSRIQFVWRMRDGETCGREVYLAYLSLEDFKVYSPAGKCLSELLGYDDMREQCVVFETAETDCGRVIRSTAWRGTGAPTVLADEDGCIACYGFREVFWERSVLAEGECALYDLETDAEAEDFRIACRFGSYAQVRRFDDGSWTEELRAELPMKKKTETVSRLHLMHGGEEIVGLLTTKSMHGKRKTAELHPIYLWIREPKTENR